MTMQKLQDSVFSITKTTGLSPAVFSFLQPCEDSQDVTPLGGILNDTQTAWLALGPKFCVVDLRTGLKIAARTFGAGLSSRTSVTSVVELPTPLTNSSKQLIIALECEDIAGTICVFHINGSQILRCMQTEVVVSELAVCDGVPDGPFSCFDGVVTAGTKSGEIFVFDLNRASLIQALKDLSQGYEHLVQNESNPVNLTFLPLNSVQHLEEQRDLALQNDDHIAVLLNESSLIDKQYILRNPDGTVRMKAKRDHVRVTVLEYIPQLGSLAVGYNFGAYQIWNLMTLDLEFTSQVMAECLPVTHFGFQEPCDDPRAFCYLWVVFSAIDRFEEEEFPLAVMYSLTYQGKRMLSDTKCLYQDFLTATIRFQIELASMDPSQPLLGGRCISCHTYSIDSTLGDEGEDSMLNICLLVWECWGENPNLPPHYGMLLFDLDQWYKDQMPSTTRLESNAFTSATWGPALARARAATLHARLRPAARQYAHATRLDEHFYPNSLHYTCISLTTSECLTLTTVGVQRQVIRALEAAGPAALLAPDSLHRAAERCGLTPLLHERDITATVEEQRRYLLSVALEARLSRFLKRCAHDWATGSHSGVGCTLTFLVDWCWQRAIQLKEYARDLTGPLFITSSLPDRNSVRCLEHCVQQLTQLTDLLDAVLTKCCNLVVPDALSEMEEKHKGISTVSLYFQVVQWFLRVGLLPENALPYPRRHLYDTYAKRRLKLHRLKENSSADEDVEHKPCDLLYIDQLIVNEFEGDEQPVWGEEGGVYPPPSLRSLLRVYLRAGVRDSHKHTLVLYTLLDYVTVLDQPRHEEVVRRLMQFPTMFGLSNTAIKATQAFWHLDHRDFDFALDQLQCLTGNTLSEWQHKVVLSSLLAQKKTQAALQYLHVRKPTPIQNYPDQMSGREALGEDSLCCVSLYLSRGLLAEALDVLRAGPHDARAMRHLYTECRNTGQLHKLLQVTLTPYEEEHFVKYLEGCNETQTDDILIMYYLQQAKYIEASRSVSRQQRAPGSVPRVLVEAACARLPAAAVAVARAAPLVDTTHVWIPKPMSVFVQATSPKNTFVYKSSFIQNTIENASETWISKPKLKQGLKRAINVEEVPFICTPKLSRHKSVYEEVESTPPKRAKLEASGTPKTPKTGTFIANDKLSREMASLLEMPDYQSPDYKAYSNRSGAETPHSILKTRRSDMDREAPSPVDSRYLGDSDEELETASNHTHYSDSTNKHLRFTIPAAGSDSGSSGPAPSPRQPIERERSLSAMREKEMADNVVTTASHVMEEDNPLESPPKKLATPDNVQIKKNYKDSVRARRSLSISANSSLSDDPNTSMESIADIPITLINPRYSNRRRRDSTDKAEDHRQGSVIEINSTLEMSIPKTPQSRRGIKSLGESTPLVNRSRSVTPERQDSPVITPMRITRTRSRSRTPELSPRSSPLAPIPEQPRQEGESEPHTANTTLSIPRQLRSRSRTPERIDKVKDSPRLAPISESPTKSPEEASPSRKSLRSRSRTPEVEIPEPQIPTSPRSLRSRSKTPEKLKSPKSKMEHSAKKKSLSRIVLESNAFAKSKINLEKLEESKSEEKSDSMVECTPMKALKPVANLMDVTFSPIVNKSVLHTSEDTSHESDKDTKCEGITPDKSLRGFTLHESYVEKSILKTYHSSIADCSSSIREESVKITETQNVSAKSIPFTLSESHFQKSVLQSYESSVAQDSSMEQTTDKMDTKQLTANESGFNKSILNDYDSTDVSQGKNASSLITNDSDVEMQEKEKDQDIQKEKERIVDIEREINEIEGECSVGSSSDEEVEDESSSEEEEDSTGEQSDEESGDDNEVISIEDTDSEQSDTTSSSKLLIDEEHSRPDTDSGSKDKIENIEEVQIEKDSELQASDSAVDPLNQARVSMMTDDNSDEEVKLTYSDDEVQKDDGVEKDAVQPEAKPVVEIQVTVEPISQESKSDNPSPVSIDIDVVDCTAAVEPMAKQQEKLDELLQEIEQKEMEVVSKSQKDVEQKEMEVVSKSQKDVNQKEMEVVSEEPKTPSRSRKRAQSTSSNKSAKDNSKMEEPKTPMTRKRTQSTASNKSVTEDQKTPESDTPSRRRGKTPTEGRKILTRRASKELSTVDETKVLEEPLTPRRRTTRSASKVDDNASVASEDSVRSARSSKSKVSEEAGPARKGRKSVVATKPDLSVIPENTVEDSSKMEDNASIISEYSTSRRMTRHQKVLLESWLEPKSPLRRLSTTSRASSGSVIDEVPEPAFDVQPIDRISLLNKGDFEGSPDPDEMRRSPDSVTSDISSTRRGRAASETKTTPKAAKISRRTSVDVVALGTPDAGSPARGRRASFTRACEALHTPKSRRNSTDLRKSEEGSPAETEGGRRARRLSTQSNTSVTKLETTRSKKSAEDTKDTKKK